MNLLILAVLLVFSAALHAENDHLHSDSFEGTRIIEVLIDSVINNGESISAGGVAITGADNIPAIVKISHAISKHQEPVILIVVSGGNVHIDLNGMQNASLAQVSAESGTGCANLGTNFPLSVCARAWTSFFAAEIDTWDEFPVSGVRIPDNNGIIEENYSSPEERKYELHEIHGAQLYTSDCDAFEVCDGDPVLLIHGYQPEVGRTVIVDNGGPDYWGEFPQRLINDGYRPYELKWLTNARFKDVSYDLREAIHYIETATGKNVHIVAHSFGGVLTRHYLQDPDINLGTFPIASVTTIGTPHNGIFRTETLFEEDGILGITFPEGQDNLGFNLCNQISCHLMGEPVLGGSLAKLLDIGIVPNATNPGAEAYFLQSTLSNLPEINVQNLIGFMQLDDVILGMPTTSGDGLIAGEGQRFRLSLVFDGEGNSLWAGPLYKHKAENEHATVTEWFLGRRSAVEDAPYLEPNGIPYPTNFVPFKHSPGTIKFPKWQYEEIEPFVPSLDGFNDVYQRVIDWISSPENQTCYTLTLTRIGEGLEPFATPDSSQGCASGSYHRGEEILLFATPFSGWNVAQWIGTDNDASISAVNQVIMPPQDHTITVIYSDELPVYTDRLATGTSFSCGATDSAQVKCWGWGFDGQLGDGTGAKRLTPVDVIGLSGNTSTIAAGGSHSCALFSNGGVACWGNNSDRQLGIPSVSRSVSPQNVPDLPSGVASISLGGTHSCALMSEGGVKCWGDGAYLKLGFPTFLQDIVSPVSVPYLESGVKAIAAGSQHSCALRNSGAVWCWGRNLGGALGNGSSTGESEPGPVVGLNSGVISISAGGDHSCAVHQFGYVMCWGANTFGELGDGTTTHRSAPVPVQGLYADFIAVATGSSHTCGLTISGGVRCWGSNGDGQLGDGTTISRSTPVAVTGLNSGVLDISLGSAHSCALMASGGIKCWGNNASGQLGNGTDGNDSLTPTDVIGFP